MKTIPVVFCFDDRWELPAGVCITSLLVNAKEDTFYDIFILHSEGAAFPNGRLGELPLNYKNCRITYRCVGDSFKNCFEIRGITIATYYRLLIPDIIPEYDKIMYHDVDVIFQNDLSEIYENTDLADNYVAGVAMPYPIIDYTPEYVKTVIKVDITQYIAAGNLIINSKKMREDHLVERFVAEAKHDWKYQDQDVLNIVCAGKTKTLPPWLFVYTQTTQVLGNRQQNYHTEAEAQYAFRYGTIHYNGAKPWQSMCYNFDVWWEYYRKSIFFDAGYYFDFFDTQLNQYDLLPLWKRIKILLRYFKTGGKMKKGNKI